MGVNMRTFGDADTPRPPLPPAAADHAGRLAELQFYTTFQQTDGYLDFHFTDSGIVEVGCGAEFSIPWALYTPEQREQSNAGTADELPETGWVGEFRVGAPGSDCPLDVDWGTHFVALDYTFEGVVERLYNMVRAGQSQAHACEPYEAKRARVHTAMERAETLFAAGDLADDEFATRFDALQAAINGHWQFNPRADRTPPSFEQIAALLLAEHPDVERVVDLRPEQPNE